jgi:hypothetical protein
MSDDQRTDAPAEKTPTRSRRPLLIGGAIVAALALVGGGIAVGVGLGDDEGVPVGAPTAESTPGASVPPAPEQTATSEPTPTPTPTAAAPAGAADADALLAVIATAAEQAEGAAVRLEARRDGSWEVDFETPEGAETEVTVAADGTASVTDQDTGDTDDVPAGALDEPTVRALVDAVFAVGEGTVLELAVDDDADSPYDATVLASDGTTVEFDLDADFAVLEVDTDS